MRICFLLRIKPDRIDEYRGRHARVWPELQTALRETGWKNYSLFVRSDGMLVGLDRFPATVLHTPGHTQGSVCLLFAPLNLVAAGDTLFAGSIGRTDLWGGSMPQIMDSLRSKLLQLPDATVVYPGHGPATTIGTERHSNPFLIT